MADLLELAERCENATGPDHVLSGDIAYAVGTYQAPDRGSPDGWWPKHTASLDAAMMLVPEGFRLERLADTTPTIQSWQKGPWVAQLATDGWPSPRLYGSSEHGSSPALAICAAALKARAASAIEARRAADSDAGAVHESAAPKADAHE